MSRDLAPEPIPHLAGALLVAHGVDPAQHTPEVGHGLALGAQVLKEFLDADIVVVGSLRYIFGIPSQLKAWIDRLAIAGKTFAYIENGPKGLVPGKTVIIASSRGGLYGPDTPLASIDVREKYLAAVFRFFGITDIRFLRAEGVNISPDNRRKAIAAAEVDAAQVIAG